MEQVSSDWSTLSVSNSTFNPPDFIHFGSTINPHHLNESNTCDILMLYESHHCRYINEGIGGRAEYTFYGRISPTEQIRVEATSRDAPSYGF